MINELAGISSHTNINTNTNVRGRRSLSSALNDHLVIDGFRSWAPRVRQVEEINRVIKDEDVYRREVYDVYVRDPQMAERPEHTWLRNLW